MVDKLEDGYDAEIVCKQSVASFHETLCDEKEIDKVLTVLGIGINKQTIPEMVVAKSTPNKATKHLTIRSKSSMRKGNKG